MWGLNPGTIARLLPLGGTASPTSIDGSRYLGAIDDRALLTVIKNDPESPDVVVLLPGGALGRIPRRRLLKVRPE